MAELAGDGGVTAGDVGAGWGEVFVGVGRGFAPAFFPQGVEQLLEVAADFGGCLGGVQEFDGGLRGEDFGPGGQLAMHVLEQLIGGD